MVHALDLGQQPPVVHQQPHALGAPQGASAASTNSAAAEQASTGGAPPAAPRRRRGGARPPGRAMEQYARRGDGRPR